MNAPVKKKLGVTETLKVLDLVVEAGNVADKVAKSDSVIAKVMAVVPMSDEILRIMSLNVSMLKAEKDDYDDAEIAQMQKHIKDKFDIADDQLEEKLEEGLGLVTKVIEVVDEAIDYVRSFRKA